MKDDDTQLAKFDFKNDAKEVQNRRDPHPDIEQTSFQKPKTKENVLKEEAPEKQFTTERATLVSLTSEFSSKQLGAKRRENGTFRKHAHTCAKKKKGKEIKSFLGKQKL